MIQLTKEHPLTAVLKWVAPIVGANFEIESARDVKVAANRYPKLAYGIHKETAATYDASKNVWRVGLVVQLDYQVQETNFKKCIDTSELEESIAVQSYQLQLTSYLRAIIQLMVAPHTLGSKLKAEDFKWSKYQFKIERVLESAYFREKGKDKVSGASSLFVISFLDLDKVVCCTADNRQDILEMLNNESISKRLFEIDTDI